MTEEIIAKLFRQTGLGTVIPPITPVSGGFLHRMYRVNTEERSFAVKHLNPEIMQRPAAAENFRRAEELEALLEAAGLPIVAAMTVNGRKLQTLADVGLGYVKLGLPVAKRDNDGLVSHDRGTVSDRRKHPGQDPRPFFQTNRKAGAGAQRDPLG